MLDLKKAATVAKTLLTAQQPLLEKRIGRLVTSRLFKKSLRSFCRPEKLREVVELDSQTVMPDLCLLHDMTPEAQKTEFRKSQQTLVNVFQKYLLISAKTKKDKMRLLKTTRNKDRIPARIIASEEPPKKSCQPNITSIDTPVNSVDITKVIPRSIPSTKAFQLASPSEQSSVCHIESDRKFGEVEVVSMVDAHIAALNTESDREGFLEFAYNMTRRTDETFERNTLKMEGQEISLGGGNIRKLDSIEVFANQFMTLQKRRNRKKLQHRRESKKDTRRKQEETPKARNHY